MFGDGWESFREWLWGLRSRICIFMQSEMSFRWMGERSRRGWESFRGEFSDSGGEGIFTDWGAIPTGCPAGPGIRALGLTAEEAWRMGVG